MALLFWPTLCTCFNNSVLGPVLVVVEYAPNGNLRDYLRQHMPLDESVLYEERQTALAYKHLVSFAYQVSRGMEYLASKKVKHNSVVVLY